jgi:hypothetical protein
MKNNNFLIFIGIYLFFYLFSFFFLIFKSLLIFLFIFILNFVFRWNIGDSENLTLTELGMEKAHLFFH